MELLFEIILELVFEGVTSSVSNKRVPLPVRIIAGIIVIGLFGGAAFLIIYAGIVCFNSTEFKATPHKERLTALYASCLHIFRHLAQISLDGRQPACAQFVQSAEKSDGAIYAQSLCGIALTEAEKYSVFLF